MYKVAKFLTLEQRRRAAAVTYTPTQRGRLFPRTQEGVCALAVAIDCPYTMGPNDFAVRLARHSNDFDGAEEVIAAASRFMADFDDGKIVDVARAMGVKRPGSHNADGS